MKTFTEILTEAKSEYASKGSFKDGGMNVKWFSKIVDRKCIVFMEVEHYFRVGIYDSKDPNELKNNPDMEIATKSYKTRKEAEMALTNLEELVNVNPSLSSWKIIDKLK